MTVFARLVRNSENWVIALLGIFATMFLLAPLIIFLSFIGSYAVRNRITDVMITVLFGVIGYFFSKLRWPSACLVLGLVLGDLVEANFHRALKIGDDSYTVFFTRPISLILFLITVVFMLWPYLSDPIKNRFRKKDLTSGGGYGW